MTRRSTLASALLAAWLLLAAGTALAGGWRPPGHAAWAAARAWWDARHYEQAAEDGDWLRLRALGIRLLARTGDDGPLRMAAYRMGVDAASPARERPPEEAEAWARAAVRTLEEHLHRSGDPWADRSLQSFILLQRVLPRSHEEADRARGLALGRAWLAAGGGPSSVSARTGETYRRLLATPPNLRQEFLARIFDVAEADGGR